jgi:hypothetical protein
VLPGTATGTYTTTSVGAAAVKNVPSPELALPPSAGVVDITW